MKLKVDKIVLILICLSLIVGLYTLYQRVEIEKQYKTTEIVLDYNEMKKFADSSNNDLSYWMRKFREFGAKSVAIQEETIKLLIEAGYSLRAQMVSELIKEYKWQEDYNREIVRAISESEISPFDVIVTTEDEEIYSYILSGLKERYADEFYQTHIFDNVYYIVLKGIVDDVYYTELEKTVNLAGKGVYEVQKAVDSRLMNIGIGYDSEKITMAKDAGLDVILRPINFPASNEKLADAYKAANEKYGLEPRIYLVHGKEVLGFPNNEHKLLNYIKEENIALALIESGTQRQHLEQEGLDELVEDSGYQALRAFTMWDFIRERNRYYNYEGAEEIENTMFRAVTERNIRVIYFKPFFEEKDSTKFLTDVDEYERTFKSLENRLSAHNISFGKAKAMEYFTIGSKRMAVLAFGITLAAVMLFIKMFNIKHKFADYLYLFALPAALIPLVMRKLAEKGFAFGSAVVFSGLAIYFFMIQIKRIYESEEKYSNLQIIVYSALILAGSVAIALAGAVFVVSMLADVKYMLEMDIFRGVKFAQILPFGIFIIMFIIYFMNKDEDSVKGVVNTTVRFLNKGIKIYYGIIAGILALAGYIYISRTGHETEIQPSNIEMITRNFMEYMLLARPRTKEFLIAFPAIFGAVFAAGKKSEFYTGIFMLAGAIGTSSVINTFSHIRTPIYLSFARTVIALVFGIVIGCVLVLVCSICNRAFVKIQERLK
ncbi:MAG: hypothetical protein KBA50_06560 [Sedimentibacter sp.]|nr:hypothetical protein [Sedimentibacter sp.]